jgi:hypothetical protein
MWEIPNSCNVLQHIWTCPFTTVEWFSTLMLKWIFAVPNLFKYVVGLNDVEKLFLFSSETIQTYKVY